MDSQSADAQPLALEAARAIQRRLASDVALDRGLIEPRNVDPRRIDEFECSRFARGAPRRRR